MTKENAFTKKASITTLQKHCTVKQEPPTVLSPAATNENFLRARRHWEWAWTTPSRAEDSEEEGSCDRGSQLPSWPSALLLSRAPQHPWKTPAVQPLLSLLLLGVRISDCCSALPQVTHCSNRGVSGKKPVNSSAWYTQVDSHTLHFPHQKWICFAYMFMLSDTNHVAVARKNLHDKQHFTCTFYKSRKSRCFSKKIHSGTNGTNQR